MKKLLLLDADVLIDLHSLDLFDKICKSYSIHVTEEVRDEAKYYKKKGGKFPITLGRKVTVVKDVLVEHLASVESEASEARLAIDPGEAISIAYLLQDEDPIALCTCDKAAIKLISYMELEEKSVSLEKALKDSGQNPKLYPRHLESKFKKNISEGKALRVQYKILK